MKYFIFSILLFLNLIKYIRTNEKIYIILIIFIDIIILLSIKIDYEVKKRRKKFEDNMKKWR